jgi:hypothetical protein
MANLKFNCIDWDKDPDLMYIAFDYNGQKIRWYPKWKEVEQLLNCSYITEGGYNKGKHNYIFQLMCIQLLLEEIHLHTPNFQPHTATQIYELFRQIKQDINSKEK